MNGKNLTYLIYDPNTLEIGYTGRTDNLVMRRSHHLSPSCAYQNKDLFNWISSIKATGKKPGFVVLEDNLSRDHSILFERKWIFKLLEIGARLKNKNLLTQKMLEQYATNPGFYFDDVGKVWINELVYKPKLLVA